MDRPWVMPEEGQPHRRTWMAFAADERIWGRDLLPRVRRDQATIATTIARFEPVSMLVRAATWRSCGRPPMPRAGRCGWR